MSEQENTPLKTVYFVAGVYKFDFKVAGYPDLKKVAQKWAQDPNFQEVIVRFVSEDNQGIQFVYLAIEDGESTESPKDKFKPYYEDVSKIGNGPYAYDVQFRSYHFDSEEAMDEFLKDYIFVLKSYK
jgi:hypothetical protein